jgi:hypothetical protein
MWRSEVDSAVHRAGGSLAVGETTCLTFALTFLVCLALSALSAKAANYSFVKVIDSTTVTTAGTLGTFTVASVSGNRAAFLAFGSVGETVGFGSGGPVTIVAKVGDPSPIGNLTFLGTSQVPSIQGTEVTVWGSSGSTCICLGNGGPLTKVIATGDPAPIGSFNALGTSVVQRAGSVVFTALSISARIPAYSPRPADQ